jgi:methionine-rich copper-binding protein CopC
MRNYLHNLSIDTRQTKIIHLLATIWLLLFLSIFLFTTTVAAHSELVKSEPEAGASLENSPAQVTAWFSEELDSETSSMRVVDSQNNQVDNGNGSVDLNDLDHLTMIVSLPPLPAGTYTVHWTSVSAEDGDAEEGEFTFNVTVGAAQGEASTPSGNTSLVWVIGIAAVILILALLAIIGISRRKGISQ